MLMISNFSISQVVAQNSLVGYWPFDEGSGKKVNDASGNGNDGEIVDNPEWVQGKFETALNFAGNGSHVVVADNESLDLTDAVTCMAWFNLNEPIAGNRRMMSKNDSIFFLFDFGVPTSIAFLVKPNNDFVESATTEWIIGEWYHVAGTYDSDTLRIYINGKLENETSGVPPIATSELDLWIGADDWQLPKTSFPGIMDEVRIYSEALSEAQINEALTGPLSVKNREKIAVIWGMLKRTSE